jgi:YegS/Rv2252/BmrU family lipid kinase
MNLIPKGAIAMIHLLINPTAGKGRGEENGKIVERLLTQRQLPFEKHMTEDAGQTTRLAQEAVLDGCTLLLAIGGDGTAGEAAQALIGTDIVLGIIPSGTGNDYVKTIGIPKNNVEAALDIALGNSTQRVDVMMVNDHACLNIASIGLDACSGYYAAKNKVLRGMAAYIYGLAFAYFVGKLPKFSYTIDDGETAHASCTLAAFANGQYYGGGFRPVPFADHTDGIMDVLLVDKLSRLRILPLLASYAKGKHVSWDICHFHRCRRFRLVSDADDVYLNIDGEVTVVKAIEIELIPQAVCIAVPKPEKEAR